MALLISTTFLDSFARLTGDEQKVVKTTVFDLQTNPDSPGLSYHKLDKARDKNFWSVRVNVDIRIIVHKMGGNVLICYVDHHDRAYDWAERRKIETHPKTGAAQIVEIRETVKEIERPVYVEPKGSPKLPLFAGKTDDELLGYGVPAEWLEDVRKANEDSLLQLADRLPAEAAEALLELATGGKPRLTQPVLALNAFEQPDALRRFRMLHNAEELERALESPWDKWSIFLHPEQRQFVEGDYKGPAKVSGSAGTGKTIVALHRAAYLARNNPDTRVLLATFSDALANSLKIQLRRLVGNEPRLAERIDVYPLNTLGLRLYKTGHGVPKIATKDDLRAFITDAANSVSGHKFTKQLLLSEWEHIVDAWQLNDWESYRDVVRLGRKTKLREEQRRLLWEIFGKVRAGLAAKGLTTQAGVFTTLAQDLKNRPAPTYDFAVVDEAQDLGVAHLRFFAALAGSRANALFFAGDTGQRIFQQPFSWKALGVEIRGRSKTLRVNYRTSHQIREKADRLLGKSVVDVDGNEDVRNDTVSVFNGPAPTFDVAGSEAEEIEAVSAWIKARAASGLASNEIGVFVRSEAQLPRAEEAMRKAGVPFKVLDENMEVLPNQAAISTMHLAKGLEFKAVAVMACDDEVVPLQERIEAVGDDGDLQEVYDTERHLLYVACTRARDFLLVSGIEPASEFLEDMANKTRMK